MLKETEIKTAIAIRLINFRDLNNLTQGKMAARLDITRSMYAKIEGHRLLPRIYLLNKIARQLKISIEELTECSDLEHS